MYVMNCDISIGDFNLNYCNAVEIESSWKTLADVCTITLPSLQKQLQRAINVGDPVSVRLGYDGNLNTEFTGFVQATGNSIPFKVTCEDSMWQLKRRPAITQSFEKISLENLLRTIIPGVEVDVPGINLEPFYINNETPAQVLNRLKDEYGLVAYAKQGRIYCGLAYQKSNSGNANYHLERNVVDHNLEYVRAEDMKIKLKAISINGQNKKEEVELGDADGETRTIHFYNLTKSELKEVAGKYIEKLKYSGFRGDLTAFGLPYAEHSWSATIASKFLGASAQAYAIDKVMTTFDDGGFRRKLKIGATL